MKDEERCQEIAENCKSVLIDTKNFTYETFVSEFWDHNLKQDKENLVTPTLRDAATGLLPLLSRGLEFQAIGSDAVRRKLIQCGFSKKINFTTSEIFDSTKVIALDNWARGIQKREILLESLLMPWASVRASEWLSPQHIFMD